MRSLKNSFGVPRGDPVFKSSYSSCESHCEFGKVEDGQLLHTEENEIYLKILRSFHLSVKMQFTLEKLKLILQ